MRKPSPAVALALLALSGCGGGITVRNAGATAPPKPKGCELEVLQKAPRDRPYDALADLESHVTNVPEEGALSVVKPKACELGADAIIVVRNMVLNEFGHTLVAVTAISTRRRRPRRPRHPPRPPGRPRLRRRPARARRGGGGDAMTERLDLEDSRRSSKPRCWGAPTAWCALTRIVFFPGGGGQPPDRGQLRAGAETLTVTDVREDGAGRLWHAVGRDLAAGVAVSGALDWPYRYALMRHHGLMHLVNTVARQLLGGIITGVQIGPERSRIDFRLGDFSAS